MPQSDSNPPDPIKLKELIERFATAVVNTSYQLDQANVELRNLYLSSGNLDLEAMSPSRYLLDEVRIDLSFVVKEARPDLLETHKLPQAHENVSETVIRPVDSKLLHAKLSEVANKDALLETEEKRKPIDRKIDELKKELSEGEAALKKARQELDALRDRPQHDPEKRKKAHEYAKLNREFHPKGHFDKGGTRWRELQENIEKVRQEKAPFDNAITLLSGKLPLTNEQIENLSKLGIRFTNWGQRWEQFYSKYESLRATYKGTVNAFRKHTATPQTENFQLTDQDQQVLQQITEKGSDWNGVKAWVGKIASDYGATLTALNALLQLMANIRGSGLKVRIDREAVAAAPVETRQKIHLTFHGAGQEKVKIKKGQEGEKEAFF